MAAWFVLLTECNMVHEVEDHKMDGSSSRNGGEANCSTHLQERGSSEDRHRLKHNIHRALNETGHACSTLLVGSCAHSSSIQRRAFLAQAKTDSRRATLQRQGSLSLLQAPRCASGVPLAALSVGH